MWNYSDSRTDSRKARLRKPNRHDRHLLRLKITLKPTHSHSHSHFHFHFFHHTQMIRTIPSLSKVSKAIPKAKAKATIPYHAMPTNINNLPRLPIPGLKDTIDRYLRSTKPLTTPSSYSHQVSLTSTFLSSVAPLLHSSIASSDALNSKDLLHSSSNSYIESHWNTMYLSGRWSLPVNSNPFYILENFRGLHDLADLTTKLVLWERNMREEGLEDDGGCQQSYPLTGEIMLR